MAKLDIKKTQEVVEKELAKHPGARSKEEAAKELIQLVVFELDREEYAVEILEVREILRMPEVTPIPNSPEFIEGIINVRGSIVVVINLEKRFNLERESEQKSLHVVLTEIGDSTFGAIVDEVTEVLRVPKDSIEDAPAIISQKIHADYVNGVVVLEGRLLIMLDFKKVFEEKGLVELGGMVQKHTEIARAHRMEEKPEEEEETEAERRARVEKLAEERITGAKTHLSSEGLPKEGKEDKDTKEEESK